MAIPRIIHYCWFGGNDKSEIIRKCISSWEKYCPDYEIKEWNESNFDINMFQYTKEAYDAKKWAFVSDVARLWVVLNYGGIYMCNRRQSPRRAGRSGSHQTKHRSCTRGCGWTQ